ncbi:MAG: murein transglycosylase [Bacteroidetes bacterium SW_11_45_7]|nr:MAG: murein transglycosylase [Bacteroidetes bacterium SW_11_45_7]
MKNWSYYMVFFLAGMLIMLLIQQYVPEQKDTRNSGFLTSSKNVNKSNAAISKRNVNTTKKVKQEARAVPSPDELNFCGEEVPLHIQDVHERFDRELLINTYWHSNTIQLLKLGGKYFPRIEEILKTHNIPQDFKYLVLAESGLRNVISPSNAVGYWQFLESTAKEYGLEVNHEVDERYHLERSTKAACKYLQDAKEELDSWTLAAASYNIGKPRLKKELKKQQADSYYELYLNRETARYMFRILALKELFEQPKSYGFYLGEEDLYKPRKFRTVKVDTSLDDLAGFARQHNTNYKQLKLLNPWLRDRSLTNAENKEYIIKLPI